MHRIASAGLSIALLVGAAPARAGEPAIQLAVSVDAPATSGLALVSGRLFTPGSAGLDLMLAIDTSNSTAARDTAQRGWRRWLGWLLPRHPGPAPASALSDQVDRAEGALARLDPRTDRAGVIAFAGSARVAAPLGDLDAARAALRALLARGPGGATNLIDALELARAELLGEIGTLSGARAGAQRTLLLLTDGVDVHPLHPDPLEASALLGSAVKRTTAAGIAVYAGCARVPDTALAGLSAAGGHFLAPGEWPEPVGGKEVAEIDVRNARSGTEATASSVSGAHFSALVALLPGINALEVRARTRSGLETRRDLEVVWQPSRFPGPRVLDMLRAHNELLAAHLRKLRARHVSARLEIGAAPAPH